MIFFIRGNRANPHRLAYNKHHEKGHEANTRRRSDVHAQSRPILLFEPFEQLLA